MARSPSQLVNRATTSDNKEEGHKSQKKRQRGRPLENSNSEVVLKRRRSQVRRAQEAFRRRKEAVTKSLEQRVGVLEECIEQMSNHFIELTDSLCRSHAIHQDPQLLRHSLTATSRILDLAQQVNLPMKTEDGSGGISDTGTNVPVIEVNKIPNPRVRAVSETANNIPLQMLLSKNSDSELGIWAWNTGAGAFTSLRLPPYSSPSSTDGILGDPWLGQTPVPVSKSHVFIDQPDRKGNNASFGFNLLQSTINIAYRYLLGESNASAVIATQMFRFALLHYSREEILFHLRWFLGPGLPYLSNLGHSFLMPEDMVEVSRSFFDPSPSVDEVPIEEGGAGAAASIFLSAYGVEDYLKSKGAIYMDDDIILLKAQSPGGSFELSGNRQPPQSTPLPDSFSGDAMAPESIPQEQQDKFQDFIFSIYDAPLVEDKNDSSSVPPTKVPSQDIPLGHMPPGTTGTSDFMKGFTFDSLLPTSGLQSIRMPSDSSWVSQISSYSAGIVTVRGQLLLQIIMHNSFCLGNGPGYPRSTVDHILNALTVDRGVF